MKIVGNTALKKATTKNFILSPKFCMHNKAIVLENDDGRVKFGLMDEKNESLKTRLLKAADEENLDAEFVGVNQEDFSKSFTRLFAVPEKKALSVASSAEAGCSTNSGTSMRMGTSTGSVTIDVSDRETVLLLDSILSEARFQEATDIHLEAGIIRFRVNGRLKKYISLEEEQFVQVVQRIKMLSKMNVMEKKDFQDGQFVFCNERPVFVRVSVIPVISGESVVLRLLDSTRLPLELEGLGFSEGQISRLREIENCKNGLVLICGATGSGKSTTAASLILEIEKNFSGEKKIVTVEDPCEYVLDGVTQINAEKNGFEKALKFIFRQDPDVIFIGEIRDEITARVALQASLTGHLVFATVHTSGFSETVMRLNDLGVPLNFLSQVLRGIVMQELCFEKQFSGKEKIVLKAEVLAVNPMARDAILRADDRIYLESTLKGLSI